MAEIEEYNKFKSVGKPLAWRQTIMDEVLQNGLTGEIPENEYIKYDEEEIIRVLKSLDLERVEEKDIRRCQTESGFDFVQFLSNAAMRNSFKEKDGKKIRKLSFVTALNEHGEEILNELWCEMVTIKVRFEGNKIDDLRKTPYYFISFMAHMAAYDNKTREENYSKLCDISRIMDIINTDILESKEKTPEVYKGITIRLFGDDTEELKAALQRTIQAIEQLPPAFRKELSGIKSINLYDPCYPSDLYDFLSDFDLDVENPSFDFFSTAGVYSRQTNVISFYDVGHYYDTVYSIRQDLAHEVGHAMDRHTVYNNGYFSEESELWKVAIAEDNKSVSEYGDTSDCEDFAETCREYSDNYYRGGSSISIMRNKFPNRLKYLEAILDARAYDPKRPSSLPNERKFEIMRMFDDSRSDIISIFIRPGTIKRLNSSPVEKKLEFVQEMISYGLPYQVKSKIINDDFLKGMNNEDLRNLYLLFGKTDTKCQGKVLDAITMYCLKNEMIDYDMLEDKFGRLRPRNSNDEFFFRKVLNTDNHNSYGDTMTLYQRFFSPEFYSKLIDILFSGYGKGL